MKFLLLLLCIILASCSEEKTEVKQIPVKKDSIKKTEIQTDTTVKDTSVRSASDIKTINTNYKTKSGKTFNIAEKKKSESISDYEISGTGFGDFKSVIKFENKDPMKNAFTADLNDDGFDELYIVTKSTGSDSYGDIFGVGSVNDNSYALIYVAELRDKQLSQSGTFTGYMGRDSIYLTVESIAREFPVYKQSDAMSNPTGGKRIVVYGLRFNNGKYELAIANSFYMQKGK